MTRSALSPATRETDAEYRHRKLVVTIGARVLELREKGRRESFAVSVEAVYDLALKLAARAKMR